METNCDLKPWEEAGNEMCAEEKAKQHLIQLGKDLSRKILFVTLKPYASNEEPNQIYDLFEAAWPILFGKALTGEEVLFALNDYYEDNLAKGVERINAIVLNNNENPKSLSWLMKDAGERSSIQAYFKIHDEDRHRIDEIEQVSRDIASKIGCSSETWNRNLLLPLPGADLVDDSNLIHVNNVGDERGWKLESLKDIFKIC